MWYLMGLSIAVMLLGVLWMKNMNDLCDKGFVGFILGIVGCVAAMGFGSAAMNSGSEADDDDGTEEENVSRLDSDDDTAVFSQIMTEFGDIWTDLDPCDDSWTP